MDDPRAVLFSNALLPLVSAIRCFEAAPTDFVRDIFLCSTPANPASRNKTLSGGCGIVLLIEVKSRELSQNGDIFGRQNTYRSKCKAKVSGILLYSK